jgi:hypothetical protein
MGKIEFFADAGAFRAVKKLQVEDTTDPIEVARFLASVQDTMQRKTRDYLAKAMPVDALDKIAGEMCGAELGKHGWKLAGKASEEKICEVLAKSRSSALSRQVNELVPTKKAQDIAKAYVQQQVLDILGFPLVIDAKVFEKYAAEKAELAE